MSQLSEVFAHIDAHAPSRIDLLRRWSAINSGTYNLSGLATMCDALRDSFAHLGAREELHDLAPAESVDAGGHVVRQPLGRALRLVKRSGAARRVFLCIHYDTVFAKDDPFQSPRDVDATTLVGPGVNDAKGGIVVLLSALSAVESCGALPDVGWEVLLNPDEEIGSPGSAALLREATARNQFGLLFEPALPDGSLVGPRKGSGNFTFVVRGRAAHAGRDFAAGRSATVALSELVVALDRAGRALGGGVTINCGRIDGGAAVNVVPDLAIGRFNVRVSDPGEVTRVEGAIRTAIDELNSRDGIAVSLHGGLHSPPKPVDERSSRLFDLALDCGRAIGLTLQIKPSGGTCDGNKLAAAGLPVIDTLGPVGGEIHSDREFVRTDTIAHRAKLTAAILLRGGELA
jgi:glutamate carboxypeptidase